METLVCDHWQFRFAFDSLASYCRSYWSCDSDAGFLTLSSCLETCVGAEVLTDEKDKVDTNDADDDDDKPER